MGRYPPIQIVDENDKPVGKASMYEAYKKGLIHQVVFIFVKDPAGNILLQKRSPDVIHYPSRWDISAGGHVDEGESYEAAAQRELGEELGLSNVPLEEIVSFREDEMSGDGRFWLKRFKKIYRTTVPKSTKFNLDKEEVTDVKWLSLEEIRRFIKEQPDQVAGGLISSLERVSYKPWK